MNKPTIFADSLWLKKPPSWQCLVRYLQGSIASTPRTARPRIETSASAALLATSPGRSPLQQCNPRIRCVVVLFDDQKWCDYNTVLPCRKWNMNCLIVLDLSNSVLFQLHRLPQMSWTLNSRSASLPKALPAPNRYGWRSSPIIPLSHEPFYCYSVRPASVSHNIWNRQSEGFMIIAIFSLIISWWSNDFSFCH